MMRNRLLISICLSAVLTATAYGQSSDPTSIVGSFYANEAKASQVFNRRNLDSRKRWLSVRLYNLFRNELKKQNAQLKIHPDDKPFFGDGFPFRPTDEPCVVNGQTYDRRYSVHPVQKGYRGSRVDVAITFFYPRPCKVEPIIYKARVLKSGSTWMIDDIIFDDGKVLSKVMEDNRY